MSDGAAEAEAIESAKALALSAIAERHEHREPAKNSP
jgi:hypothetical protein